MKKWYSIVIICAILALILALVGIWATQTKIDEEEILAKMQEVEENEDNAAKTLHEEYSIFSAVSAIPQEYQDKMSKREDTEIYQMLLNSADEVDNFITAFAIPNYEVEDLSSKWNSNTSIVATASRYVVSKVEYENMHLYYTMDSYYNPDIYYLHFYITHQGTTLEDISVKVPKQEKYLKGYIVQKEGNTITVEGGLEYIENDFGKKPIENAKIRLTEDMVITNIENMQTIDSSDVKVGDQITVTADYEDGWMFPDTISMVPKETIDTMKQSFLQEGKMDGSISKKEEKDGVTFIWFETGEYDVQFHLLVEVTPETRTILGREDYVLQDNYGIHLHEITTLKLKEPADPDHLVARVLEFIAD